MTYYRLILLFFVALRLPASANAQSEGAAPVEDTGKSHTIAVVIQGMVKNPARYVLRADTDVSGALEAAGGLDTENRFLRKLSVTREEEDGKKRVYLIRWPIEKNSPPFILKDGDIVFAKEAIPL